MYSSYCNTTVMRMRMRRMRTRTKTRRRKSRARWRRRKRATRRIWLSTQPAPHTPRAPSRVSLAGAARYYWIWIRIAREASELVEAPHFAVGCGGMLGLYAHFFPRWTAKHRRESRFSNGAEHVALPPGDSRRRGSGWALRHDSVTGQCLSRATKLTTRFQAKG